MASTCEAGEKAEMGCPNERRSRWTKAIRTMCVAAAVLLVSTAVSGEARGGLIVNCDMSVGGDMNAPQHPADDQPLVPQVCERQQYALLFLGTLGDGGGAGSQSPTSSLSTGLIAMISDEPHCDQPPLSSRLALYSRIRLPSPLQDRFFRPPRIA